jgi:sialate O-acetylesterase
VTNVRLPSLIGDNMVLQRGMRTPVWGYAPPGESVDVRIAGQRHVVTAETDGRWAVRLDPMPAGGPHELVVSAAGSRIVAGNVLFGDVWVASGQSNMVWPLSQARNGTEETAAASLPFTGPCIQVISQHQTSFGA